MTSILIPLWIALTTLLTGIIFKLLLDRIRHIHDDLTRAHHETIERITELHASVRDLRQELYEHLRNHAHERG